MTLFEWDDAKAKANLRKHGVSFELARSVFMDPYLVLIPDRAVGGEQRWQAIGSAEGRILLLVAHAVNEHGNDETIRIISARQATRRETRLYEDQ
jgi:uncharacterized DUF497 family protein